jgi:hypothetical protein
VAITDATVNPWAKALGLVEEGTPFSIWDIVPVWNRPDWDTKPEEDVVPTARSRPFRGVGQGLPPAGA